MTRTHASESGVAAPPEPVPHPAEAVLLQRLRDGHDEAFGELYELHVGAVRRLARGLSADRSEADDITAETFFRVLQALRRGSGPRDSARAYLLTVARRVSWEWQAARREVPIPDDELTSRIGSAHEASTAEQTLIANAFSRLPERWRVVLWQTEVEGVQPAVVAPHFGLSPNATAALARRARMGLRAAYLQAHVATREEPVRCQTVLDKLGGYTAGMVTGTQARKVRAHLRRCPTCRSTHGQLRDVFSSLRTHAGALVVLVPAGGLAIAGAGSSAAGSAASTALVALGTKLKVGVAVASTTAAGALAATPVVVDWGQGQPLGLPGHRVELTLAPSSSSEAPTSTSTSTGNGQEERQESEPRSAVTVLSPQPAAWERAQPAQQDERAPDAAEPETERTPSKSETQPGSTPPGVQPRLDTGATTTPSESSSSPLPETSTTPPSRTPTATPTTEPSSTDEPSTTDPPSTEPSGTESPRNESPTTEAPTESPSTESPTTEPTSRTTTPTKTGTPTTGSTSTDSSAPTSTPDESPS